MSHLLGVRSAAGFGHLAQPAGSLAFPQTPSLGGHFIPQEPAEARGLLGPVCCPRRQRRRWRFSAVWLPSLPSFLFQFPWKQIVGKTGHGAIFTLFLAIGGLFPWELKGRGMVVEQLDCFEISTAALSSRQTHSPKRTLGQGSLQLWMWP